MIRLLLLPLLLLASCADIEQPRTIAIVGATWIDGSHAFPNSVVVVRESMIQAAGPQQTTPIPAGSEKINGAGKFVAAPSPAERLAPGAPATLVLLSADPLRDPTQYGRPERTMRNGVWTQ